jgi:hypothetical protein
MTKAMNRDERVSLGRQVEARVKRPAAAIVAVRMPRDLLAQVSDYASTRELTVSDVIRDAVDGMVGSAEIAALLD